MISHCQSYIINHRSPFTLASIFLHYPTIEVKGWNRKTTSKYREASHVEFESDTVKKSTGTHACEKRLYVSNLPPNASQPGTVIRSHWSIESMHWALDSNFLQDKIKRRSMKAARNLDTLQRIVHALFSIWRGRRKKLSDKAKGIAELMRGISMSFTKLMRFLSQK